MKKYLITDRLLHTLQNLSMPRHLAEELDELKPIEPLTEAQIMEIVSHKPFNSAIGFARAIEQRIIGEAE